MENKYKTGQYQMGIIKNIHEFTGQYEKFCEKYPNVIEKVRNYSNPHGSRIIIETTNFNKEDFK